jgi:hypothetical protein
MKKMDQKMFDHSKALFNIAYYTAKNNKLFSDTEGLSELTGKFGGGPKR